MQQRKGTGRRAASLAALVGMGLAACGGGTATLDAGDVEDAITEELEDAGVEAGVSCPDDIEAVDGEEFSCEVEPDDGSIEPFDVDGEVDGAEGDFTFELPDDIGPASDEEEDDEDEDSTTTTTEASDEDEDEDEDEGAAAEISLVDSFDDNANGWAEGELDGLSVDIDEELGFYVWDVEPVQQALPFLSFPDELVPAASDLRSMVVSVVLEVTPPGIAGIACMIADPEGEDFSEYDITVREGVLAIERISADGEAEELDSTPLDFDIAEVQVALVVRCEHDPETGVTEVEAAIGGSDAELSVEDEDGIPAGVAGLVVDTERTGATSPSEPTNRFSAFFDDFEFESFAD